MGPSWFLFQYTPVQGKPPHQRLGYFHAAPSRTGAAHFADRCRVSARRSPRDRARSADWSETARMLDPRPPPPLALDADPKRRTAFRGRCWRRAESPSRRGQPDWRCWPGAAVQGSWLAHVALRRACRRTLFEEAEDLGDAPAF